MEDHFSGNPQIQWYTFLKLQLEIHSSALNFHIYSMPGTFYNPSASHQISNFVFFSGRQVLRSPAKNILSPMLFLKGAKMEKNQRESK